MSSDVTVSGSGLPRVSGGVSRRSARRRAFPWSSPRKRGCFHVLLLKTVKPQSSPRKRGCFHVHEGPRREGLRLPRVSGGVSEYRREHHVRTKSSPRKRGCFQHGRLRRRESYGLPRVSGGVSPMVGTSPGTGMSSPRKRGCFVRSGGKTPSITVFPA